MIWKQAFNVETLNQTGRQTMVEHLGIEFTGFGDDFLEARMPVGQRTMQPMGLLHGGASCVLAETMGSVASFLCIEDASQFAPVGVEINANHLRPATRGYVSGKVSPLRIGRKLHVWNIEIKDEEERLICVSRITIAVVSRR
ncbi:MAG: hotdog fold thioesterase [Lewinellaceae bacterium]|nr:hotdog fold thioesterase [Phaeodactylibacter sp.]MCB0613878.1 hotdog fold thioesterase [Phaeodactylibacter sp.]MCB9349102.1 hotdog fold thioesterase [Lewinellaceae bacterium]